MPILTCTALPPLLDAAYRHFAATVRAEDGSLQAFEHAVDADAPDNKLFRDYRPSDGWRDEDEPIRRLHRELAALLDSSIDELSRVIMPQGPALSSLLSHADEHVLRLSLYPASKGGLVNHPHADIDLVTLLPAATADGLEVLEAGEWKPLKVGGDQVFAMPGEFAEMFGGRAATRHRVSAVHMERMSISFFANAAPALRIGDRSVQEIFAERLGRIGSAASREGG